jgi:hypothetical protein
MITSLERSFAEPRPRSPVPNAPHPKARDWGLPSALETRDWPLQKSKDGQPSQCRNTKTEKQHQQNQHRQTWLGSRGFDFDGLTHDHTSSNTAFDCVHLGKASGFGKLHSAASALGNRNSTSENRDSPAHWARVYLLLFLQPLASAALRDRAIDG